MGNVRGVDMPIGMPYHLEKGPTLRLLEQHLAVGRAGLRTVLDQLRASAGSVDWVAHALPALWADPRFQAAPQGSGAGVRDDIVRRWFGYERTTPVGSASESWARLASPTTGYWIAYDGDVGEIVRRALVWAVELALGLEPGAKGPGRNRPYPIEVFWKCPAPWFEAWVVQRPADHGGSPRGVISIVFVTPSHVGSNVAESPLAASASASPPGSAHPVPSWQGDYEVLGVRPEAGAAVPKVAPSRREYATWVVTHADHQLGGSVSVTSNTAAAADFAEWGIPQLGIYHGTGDVVIVSPSFPSGGVKADGSV